jgi:hypothetical protein
MRMSVSFLGMVVLCVAAPLGAGERLTIRVSPSVAFAPANLAVKAIVPTGACLVRAVLRGAGGHEIAYSEMNMSVVAGRASSY